jgi:cell division protein FtsW
LAIGVGLVALLIKIAPYRLERFTTFLDPSADKLGAGYHINQSLLAIGSGGLWGRGFGQSLQKYLYLPEPHTDSIFAIVVEELGFLRAVLVLVVIGLFIYRGYQVAFRAGDDFGRMVAFGVTTWLLVQCVLNIAAIMGLVPLTGVPLPLISYGGTSLIASLIGIGIVVNISRQSYGK